MDFYTVRYPRPAFWDAVFPVTVRTKGREIALNISGSHSVQFMAELVID